jgi:soluble lytic murein transglycosylase-like protein
MRGWIAIVTALALLSACGPKEGPLPPTPSMVNTGQYAAIVNREAAAFGVSFAIVMGVIDVESGGNARAVSPSGAKGLMQLSPATARKYGLDDPFDPAANIAAGTHVLHDLLARYHGDIRLALAAYNAGLRAVDAAGGVPAKSRAYVDNVLRASARFDPKNTSL